MLEPSKPGDSLEPSAVDLHSWEVIDQGWFESDGYRSAIIPLDEVGIPAFSLWSSLAINSEDRPLKKTGRADLEYLAAEPFDRKLGLHVGLPFLALSTSAATPRRLTN